MNTTSDRSSRPSRSSSSASLSQPLPLPCGVTIKNRIAKSATSEALADREHGAPTEQLVRLYERWGRGGAGLLITGNVAIADRGRTEPGNVVIRDDRDLEGLRRWAEAAQAHGSQLWMQLNHSGRQSPRRITSDPVAPSAVGLKGFNGLFATPRELDRDEIQRMIERFAVAAAVAKDAGFAGVQLHAAHGYLINQFLSPLSNRRTDDHGGSIANRMRMLLEVIRAVRGAVGPDYPIGVKLNSADFQRGGFDQDDSRAVAVALQREGIDLLEISGGNYEKSAMMGGEPENRHHDEIGERSGSQPGERRSTREREAYFLQYAREIRSQVTLPLMLTGGMRTAATMAEVLDSGAVDVIGMGRPLTVEPDLPRTLLRDPAAAAVTVKTRLGIRLFDDMLQIVWFQAQLRRMARGLEPDPGLGRIRALLAGFFRNYAFNPLRLRGARSPALDDQPRLPSAVK